MSLLFKYWVLLICPLRLVARSTRICSSSSAAVASARLGSDLHPAIIKLPLTPRTLMLRVGRPRDVYNNGRETGNSNQFLDEAGRPLLAMEVHRAAAAIFDSSPCVQAADESGAKQTLLRNSPPRYSSCAGLFLWILGAKPNCGCQQKLRLPVDKAPSRPEMSRRCCATR